MNHYSAVAWLATGTILTAQALVVYAIFRYISVGRPRVSPFRQGWKHLVQRYGTANGPQLLDMTSVIIGSASYSNSMQVAFGETDIFMRKYFHPQEYVQLPYRNFTVVTPPRRITILRFPLTTAGIFSIAGVEISFANSQAVELLKHLEKLSPAVVK